MKRLQALALAEKRHIIGLVVAAVMIGLSILAQAYLIVDIVDQVFLKNASFASIVPTLGWLILALITRAGFGYMSGGLERACQRKRNGHSDCNCSTAIRRTRLRRHYPDNPGKR
ncbi:hypothetical protein [Exiguobacterium mexicanum]|uniref:hypothetical protein n=1 Tax=Exiguobacterium mexicanum TaxID=340146 RepID=UPI0037C18440